MRELRDPERRRCSPSRLGLHRLPRMFEAHFQSFEDRSERAEGAPRVAALRAELAQARARRFHRAARRPLPERIRAAERRAAGLAHRLHRLGRRRHRARRPRRDFRRRPLSGAGARGSRRRGFHRRASGRKSADAVDRSQPAGRRQARLFAVAAYGRRRRAARQSLRRGRASLVPVDDNPIDAIWTDRPQPPLGAVVRARSALRRRRRARTSSTRVRAEMEKVAADALVVSDPQAVSWLFNIRGSDVPHTPVVLAFAMVPKEGRPALYRRSAQARQRDAARISKRSPRCARTPISSAISPRSARSSARCGSIPPTCAEAIARLVIENGGAIVRGSDPIAPMKAVKNATEIAGARAAQQRDGAAVTRFLAWFDREAPRGELTEIDAVEALESFPPRDRAAQGRFVPDHRRRRTERRHRALSRHPQKQPPHRAGRTVSDRFRRPIRGRHHRHHPHRRGRHAERRHAQEFHAGAQGPYRASRARCFPTAPAARSSIRWRGNISGRPGSISITAPATASAAIFRCTRGRRASPSSAA